MRSAHCEHQFCLSSSRWVQRKLPRDLPTVRKITLPRQPTNTAAVICGCRLQSVCSEQLEGITHYILQKNAFCFRIQHQFVFTMLQKYRQYEVEEYLQNTLTCIHQVPQNSAGFSRLDSTSKPLTEEFKGHINLLATVIYDKRFMTPKKIKKITFLLHLTARNEHGILPLVCRESAKVEMIHQCKPSAWESEKYHTDANCKVNYNAVSQ